MLSMITGVNPEKENTSSKILVKQCQNPCGL